MKALNFSTESWHYRLATVYRDSGYWNVSTDLCGYIRNVLTGTFVALIITAALGAFAMSLSDVLCWIAVSAQYSNWGQMELSARAAPMIFVVGGGSVFGTVAGIIYLGTIAKDAVQEKLGSSDTVQSSFIAEAYRSIKEKTCVRISFKEKEDV